MYKCFYCQHELIWNNDFDSEDVYENEELRGRVVSYFTCPECGAEYEVLQPSFVPPKNMQN